MVVVVRTEVGPTQPDPRFLVPWPHGQVLCVVEGRSIVLLPEVLVEHPHQLVRGRILRIHGQHLLYVPLSVQFAMPIPDLGDIEARLHVVASVLQRFLEIAHRIIITFGPLPEEQPQSQIGLGKLVITMHGAPERPHCPPQVAHLHMGMSQLAMAHCIVGRDAGHHLENGNGLRAVGRGFVVDPSHLHQGIDLCSPDPPVHHPISGAGG